MSVIQPACSAHTTHTAHSVCSAHTAHRKGAYRDLAIKPIPLLAFEHLDLHIHNNFKQSVAECNRKTYKNQTRPPGFASRSGAQFSFVKDS